MHLLQPQRAATPVSRYRRLLHSAAATASAASAAWACSTTTTIQRLMLRCSLITASVTVRLPCLLLSNHFLEMECESPSFETPGRRPPHFSRRGQHMARRDPLADVTNCALLEADLLSDDVQEDACQATLQPGVEVRACARVTLAL